MIPKIDPQVPAFPCVQTRECQDNNGFTKREEFAKCFMAGLLANPETVNIGVISLAETATTAADALISELNKEPNGQP